MATVIILQHRLLHYRIGLFDILKDKLSDKGVELKLIHGGASATELKRKDEGQLVWSTRIRNKFFRINGVDLIWQCLPFEVLKCDLLILMQENRILSNYPCLLFHRIRRTRVAYWGHGRNLQAASSKGYRERWKRFWLKSVDWWFGYTRSTAQYLTEQGYPERNITSLNNAVDVETFKAQVLGVSNDKISTFRMSMGMGKDTVVGLFCGSLYKEKRLDLLLSSVDIIKRNLPGFHLVVIGDGPARDMMERACDSRPWIHLVGVKTGVDKAVYYRMSKFVLNPGLVGLHILDSFAAGIPMITTNDALHSPEFDYLIAGVNGIVTAGNADDYSAAVLELIADENFYLDVCSQVLSASENYTVDAMADNFCRGILQCLDL